MSIYDTDESKFIFFYSDGKVSVWRKPGTCLALKNLSPTVKHGGDSIMGWGCFSYQGVGKLVFIEGKMNSMDYINILSNNLPSSAANMGLSDHTFSKIMTRSTNQKLQLTFSEQKDKSTPMAFTIS
ncbi:Transposable element Tcb1 transposase [Nosema granulosis]|uniref:Transposable element Tcb1 transposase n=1 Tax=Nosema granulosis TaxID=83296 RepID=A0A9P6GWH4_9MICR|nr:Transposable element Tcb1 transposase [Nosema granulosis]